MSTFYLTWKEVAAMLAKRMQNHAYCETHPEDEEDLVDCAFCRDRFAYKVFLRKAAS